MIERIKGVKLISAIFGLLVAMLTVSFAVSNRQSVTVSLWPTDFAITMPLVALIIFVGAVCFFLGWLFSWFRNVTVKLKLKKENKNMKKMLEESETAFRNLQRKINEDNSSEKVKKTKSLFFG